MCLLRTHITPLFKSSRDSSKVKERRTFYIYEGGPASTAAAAAAAAASTTSSTIPALAYPTMQQLRAGPMGRGGMQQAACAEESGSSVVLG